jgi:hypothetical protein
MMHIITLEFKVISRQIQIVNIFQGDKSFTLKVVGTLYSLEGQPCRHYNSPF